MPDAARTGKIGRCPVAIRNEVNRRLHENEGASKIITWLHSQPVVLKILDEYFGEEPIKPQNISEWRKGGYQDWLKRQEQVEHTKDLADHALKLGEAAGGNISDGSAAIAGGRIMALLENAADDDLGDLVKSITLLRLGDSEKAKLDLRRQTVKQRDEVIGLAKKKFQRDTCALFVKWSKDDRAKKILESRATNSEKIEQLGQAIFGEDWE